MLLRSFDISDFLFNSWSFHFTYSHRSLSLTSGPCNLDILMSTLCWMKTKVLQAIWFHLYDEPQRPELCWTNTFSNLDKFILQVVQIHFASAVLDFTFAMELIRWQSWCWALWSSAAAATLAAAQPQITQNSTTSTNLTYLVTQSTCAPKWRKAVRGKLGKWGKKQGKAEEKRDALSRAGRRRLGEIGLDQRILDSTRSGLAQNWLRRRPAGAA